MTEEEMKTKYSAFVTEVSEILGLGKPVDILKLCATTDLFFQPLEKRIAELEKENAELKKSLNCNNCSELSEEECEGCAEYSHFKCRRKDQFTKAKELIRKLIEAIHIWDCKNLEQVEAEAEQFISEVENE